MTKSRELRVIGGGFKLERRAEGDEGADKSPRFEGYAAEFDVDIDIGGMFVERIAPGAFDEALASSDIHALFNHDEGSVLGRKSAGTLELETDARGLKATIHPPDTSLARDLVESVERGDIDQMSIAFSMRDGIQEWDDTVDPPVRTIKQFGELFDVSIVTRGANPTTDVAVRSLEQFRKDEKHEQRFNAATFRIRRKMDLGLRAARAGRKAAG